MATIPLGNFGNAVANEAPLANIPRGDPLGVASERIGSIGSGIAADMEQQRLRAVAQQEHEAKQQRDAAERAQSLTTLIGTRQALKDLHDEKVQAVLDGTIPKDKAESDYRTEAAKLLSDAAPKIPESHRQIAVAELNGDAMSHAAGVRRAVTVRDRQDVTSGIEQTLEYLQRSYKSDPAKATQQAMDTLDQLGPFSTLNPEQLSKMKQGWKENTQFTTGYEMVSAARDSRKALDAAEAALKNLPDLDPQRRAVLTDRVQAYRLHLDQKAEMAAARAERENERRLREAEATFNVVQSMADKGTLLDPAFIDQAVTKTTGTPYGSAIVALAQQAREQGGIAAQPIPVQRQMLDQINAQIAQQGRNPALDQRKEAIEKVLTGSQADLEKDALRAGLERGVIRELKPLDMSGGIPGLVAQLGERSKMADRVSSWAGRAVSPMTSEEAAHLGKSLGSLPVAQRAEAIALLTSQMQPAQGQELAGQIASGHDDQSRALGYAMAYGAARTTEGRTTAEIMLRGADALKSKTIKEEKVAVDGWRGQIAAQVAPLYQNPRQADAVIESARFILAGLVSEGASGSTDDAKHAVRLAVGGTVSDINGARIVVPAGLDSKDVRARLRSMTPEDIKAQSTDGRVYVSGVSMPAEQFLAGLPDAQLRYAGRSQDASRARYYVIAGGTLAANSMGNPIVVEVGNAR